MNYELTAFDVFPDGWVKTIFKVDAPSEEVAEHLIKKQLSKLFRDFPAGSILTGGMPMAGFAPLQPTWEPQWVPNVNTNISGQGQYVLSSPVFVQGIPNEPSAWMVNYPNQYVSVGPGQTIHLNGAPVGNAGSVTFTVTNSTGSEFQITPSGIQLPHSSNK